MKCQLCYNPATVHLSDIVDGQKHKIHLCQGCAEKQHFLKGPNQDLNLSAIVQSVITPHLGQPTDELGRLTCPVCGIKYMEFKAEGRLGCPHDYQVFRAGLEPLLLRIHRAVRHTGKVAAHALANAAREAQIVQLRQQLRTAVEAEAYEEAARLRDLLRQKENDG